MRGRKPKSSQEKLAKGETRPSRVNYDEPEVPPPSDLEAPKDLRGAGFRMWRDHAEAMVKTGQLRSTDMPLFHRHCHTASDIELWRKERAKRNLDRQTMIAIQRTIDRLESLFVRQAAELGMSSVSRSRVKTVVKPPVEKPKHERFFGTGKGLSVIRGGRG